MRRREFITALGAAFAWPCIARAQRSSLPVVGFLGTLSAADGGDLVSAFNQTLNGMGFLDGRNVAVEPRWADGQPDRLGALASDLVQRKAAVAIIASGSGAAALAAKTAAAGVIPVIVVEGDLDPVKAGLVGNMNHPGANITGLLLSHPTLMPKRLEILQEAAPSAAIVGMLVNPHSADAQQQSSEAQAAATAAGLTLKIVSATNEDEIDNAFASALVTPQVGAFTVSDDMFLLTQRDRIVAAAATNALPAIYPQRAYVSAGGLMSYAANLGAAFHQAGDYTAKILVGQKPGDLPVLHPTKFELVINRKTANTLQIPDSVVTSADRIFEGGNPNEAAPLWFTR
jgi:putative ABC transport system substrate-binding protein